MNKRKQQILDLLSDGKERMGFEIAKALRWPWWAMPIYIHLAELEDMGLIVRRIEAQGDRLLPIHYFRKVEPCSFCKGFKYWDDGLPCGACAGTGRKS